jgi:ABC-2 type transport system permease protein
MIQNAVLRKELTTRMRGWRSSLVIIAYVTILAGIVLLQLSTTVDPQSLSASAQLGQNLFVALAGFQMALVIFVTPASTADAISGERQRQTLDLLLVTGLSSQAIVFGKLFAGLAFDLLLILSSIPLFSLVFLFGGIGPAQFVSLFVTFLASTLLIGSMSLFISTITRRSGAAVVLSMLATLGITIGLVIVSLLLSAANRAAGNPDTMPFTAYLDPLVGLAAVLPFTQDLGSIDHFTAGPLHLSLWQDQMLANLILSALFIVGSIRLLRPKGAPMR